MTKKEMPTKNRKRRNTDYSVTQRLIKHYGEKRLYEL
jgi:hypothetical protein